MNLRKPVHSLLLLALLCLAISATERVAIAQSFIITNDANNQVHGFPHWVGTNSQVRLNPTGGNFEPSATGNCPVLFDINCNGLRVLNVTDGAFGRMISASPTEIKVVFPTVSSDGQKLIVVQRFTQGNWIASHSRTEYFEDGTIQPFVQNVSTPFGTKIMLRGSLYNHDGTVLIKSLTDGLPNPRTYQGQNTLVQAYYTGVQAIGSSGTFIRLHVNGSLFGFGFFDAEFAPGAYVINIRKRDGAWTPGFNEFVLVKSVATPFDQDASFFATVWWDN